MQVSILANNGIDPDAILAIRSGTVRRQSAASSSRPMRFPHLSVDGHPIKVDILKQVGTAYLVLKPGEEQYNVVFRGAPDMPEVSCELGVRRAEGGHAGADHEAELANPHAATGGPKDYLESHRILQFVQAVLHSVIKEKPPDPYEYMARHFMSGYRPADARTPVAHLDPAPHGPAATAATAAHPAAEEELAKAAPTGEAPAEAGEEEAKAPPAGEPAAEGPDGAPQPAEEGEQPRLEA